MSALASPGAELAQRGGMPPAVRALAAELLPRAPALARGLTDHLVANMPELSAGDDDLREETRASVEGNVDQVLRLLKLGARADALVVPPDAAEYVRGLVRRGITLAVLLRTYRLGHAWFWDVWCEALTRRVADPPSSSSPRIRAPGSSLPTSMGSPACWWTPTAPSASA